ncbi:ricin-type beta-trefoil lectin domain protein [Streptomyces sp. NPDC017991]|uniref:ricin-type beta-trefoil lectin domain protein n=1 Tax=Streptomyces sp. NPDC017991 TaxID=3365026 RepID=UPI0037B97E7A
MNSGSGSSDAASGRALVVVGSGECLSRGDGTEGIQLVQATCDNSAAQHWLIGSDGGIRSSGKCVTVAGGATADRTEIQLTRCRGDASQRFHFSGAELLADQSKKCVTVFRGLRRNGGGPLVVQQLGQAGLDDSMRRVACGGCPPR